MQRMNSHDLIDIDIVAGKFLSNDLYYFYGIKNYYYATITIELKRVLIG